MTKPTDKLLDMKYEDFDRNIVCWDLSNATGLSEKELMQMTMREIDPYTNGRLVREHCSIIKIKRTGGGNKKYAGLIFEDTEEGKWENRRFKKNDPVTTEYGDGIVVDIDLPLSASVFRWVVLITKPIKKHSLIDENKPLCFFDREINKL